MKRATVNFIVSLLYQVITLLVGLFLPKYYTEIFGSVYNGLNSSVSQIMSLLAVLQFGIAAPTISQMFQYIAKDDKEQIAAIYWDAGRQYRRMGYIFITAIIPIIILFPLAIKENLPYHIIVTFILFRTISAAMEYFFQAKYSIILTANNLSYVIYIFNIVMLLFSTVLHVLVLMFVKNILAYQAVLVVSTLVRLVVVSTYINKKMPYLRQYKKTNRKVEKTAQRKDVLVSEIAGVVIDSTDLLVLSSMSGLVSASIYSVYNYVTSGLGSILGSCREAVFAGIGKTYYENFENFQKKISQFESVYIFLAYLMYSIAIVLFRPFVEAYTAKMDANYCLPGLAVMFVLAKLVVNIRIPSIVAINTAGHFKQVRNYAVIEAVINLTVSLCLVKSLGIYGVLLGTLAGGLYRTPILIHYANKNIIKRKTWVYWKKNALWLPLFVCCYLISIIKPIQCQSLVQWIGYAVPVLLVILSIFLVWMFFFDRKTLYSLREVVKRFVGRREKQQ